MPVCHFPDKRHFSVLHFQSPQGNKWLFLSFSGDMQWYVTLNKVSNRSLVICSHEWTERVHFSRSSIAYCTCCIPTIEACQSTYNSKCQLIVTKLASKITWYKRNPNENFGLRSPANGDQHGGVCPCFNNPLDHFTSDFSADSTSSDVIWRPTTVITRKARSQKIQILFRWRGNESVVLCRFLYLEYPNCTEMVGYRSMGDMSVVCLLGLTTSQVQGPPKTGIPNVNIIYFGVLLVASTSSIGKRYPLDMLN